MSLSVPRAVSTIALNSSSEIQQLAIHLNSFLPVREFCYFFVDLCRYLEKARNSLDYKVQTSLRTWHVNAALKDHLDGAISGELLFDRELYTFTQVLNPVVIFFYMYAGAGKQRKEAEKTISGWPVVARQLFAILLARIELPEDMSCGLKMDKRYNSYMRNPKDLDAATQPPNPERIYIEMLGVILWMETSAGQEMAFVRAQERQHHIKKHALEILLTGPVQNQHEPNWVQLPPQELLEPRGQNLSLAQLLSPVDVSTLNTRSVQRVNLPFTVGTLCESLRCIMSGTVSNYTRDIDCQDVLKPITSERLHAILPLVNKEGKLHDMPMILRIGSSIEFYLMKEMTQRLMQWKHYTDYHQLHFVTWQELLDCIEGNIELEVEGKATAELFGNGRITFFLHTSSLGMIIQFDRSIFRYVANQF